MSSNETKKNRITVGLTDLELAALQQAAELSHKTMADMVRESVKAHAHDVLANRPQFLKGMILK